MKTENRWISLCRVNRPDRNDNIWLERVADVVDGALVAVKYNDDLGRVFENRPLIFHQEGPDTPDYIGFWEWTEVAKDDGTGWRSESAYIEGNDPIEIIMLQDISNASDMVKALEKGVSVPTYVHGNTLLVYADKSKALHGVLCNLNDFDKDFEGNGLFTLNDEVKSLMLYDIFEDDIIAWKNRKIYNKISLREPVQKLYIHIPIETIKQIILGKMSWPVFKAQEISKKDWRKFKDFLEAVPTESLYAEIAAIYDVNIDETEAWVNSFLESVESYIDVDDIDSSVFSQIVKNHSAIRERCEKIAVEQWKEENKSIIDAAYAEAEQIKKQSCAEKEVVMSAVAKLREEEHQLISKIETARGELDSLNENIAQAEKLGDDTVVAVQNKIAEAQNDMAGFIADVSAYLPMSKAPSSEVKANLWNYERAKKQNCAEDIELLKDWKDEFYLLWDNLADMFSVNADIVGMLSAFLYSAFVNCMPVLFAGPCGNELADAVSISICGSDAGKLTLGNECDFKVVSNIDKYDEKFISVQNMFSKGWSDILPQTFAGTEKHVFWSHPYAEDLILEPTGLYNYMMPLLSECFIEAIKVGAVIPGQRAETFKEYSSDKQRPLRIAAFKELKLSKLFLKQLGNILSDAKAILDDDAKEKDIEILCGLLPIAILTGKRDVLKEIIENETGVSSAVKKEVERYIEE